MSPDDVIASIEALPFPAGRCPYRIKGVAYRGQLEHIEATLEGGFARVAEHFPDPGYRRFYEQSFLPSVLYDVFPLVVSSAIVAKLTDKSFEEVVETRARFQAGRDLVGIYKMMLRLAPSTILAKRVPRVLGQYFDFAELESRAVGPGHVQTRVWNIPVELEPWFRICLESYCLVVIETGGAKAVKASAPRVRIHDERDGVQLSELLLDVSWAV